MSGFSVNLRKLDVRIDLRDGDVFRRANDFPGEVRAWYGVRVCREVHRSINKVSSGAADSFLAVWFRRGVLRCGVFSHASIVTERDQISQAHATEARRRKVALGRGIVEEGQRGRGRGAVGDV